MDHTGPITPEGDDLWDVCADLVARIIVVKILSQMGKVGAPLHLVEQILVAGRPAAVASSPARPTFGADAHGVACVLLANQLA